MDQNPVSKEFVKSQATLRSWCLRNHGSGVLSEQNPIAQEITAGINKGDCIELRGFTAKETTQ